MGEKEWRERKRGGAGRGCDVREGEVWDSDGKRGWKKLKGIPHTQSWRP